MDFSNITVNPEANFIGLHLTLETAAFAKLCGEARAAGKAATDIVVVLDGVNYELTFAQFSDAIRRAAAPSPAPAVQPTEAVARPSYDDLVWCLERIKEASTSYDTAFELSSKILDQVAVRRRYEAQQQAAAHPEAVAELVEALQALESVQECDVSAQYMTAMARSGDAFFAAGQCYAPAPSSQSTGSREAAMADTTNDGVTVLPDGSAFAVSSFPLPTDHWLYAPRGEWDSKRDDYAETPRQILTNAQRAAVAEAARYAIRGATMCGRAMDFDPDALVLNICYALCGPAPGRTLTADTAPAVQPEEKKVHWPVVTRHSGGAISDRVWLRLGDGPEETEYVQSEAVLTEQERLREFRTGVCVGLQVLAAFAYSTAWAELVRTAGISEMLQHAAHVEPDEWDLAGFSKYARSELGRGKPAQGGGA